MTIVVTGGGSGGHITPILAVAEQLKRLEPGIRIVYIGQRGDKLADIPAADPNIDAVYSVRAGKFRRYYGEGWKQLFDLSTQTKNLRDAVYVCIGLLQSYLLMRRLKPSLVFTRGGFVSVPVALGGKLAGVPYITHDSDSVPSLANRMIARWARLHAVALPAELYPYPLEKTTTVGIPLNSQYERVTPIIQQQYKHQIGLPRNSRMLLLTGGGNGADALNQAMLQSASALLKRYPALHIVHFAGRAAQQAVSTAYDGQLTGPDRSRIHVEGFVPDFYRYSGAADVIVSRAGATNLAEYAVQAKACIIVPAAQLVGGHQTKNAANFAKHDAIVLMSDEQIEQEHRLAYAISELLDDPERCRKLGDRLHTFGYTNAADHLAHTILDLAGAGKP